MFQVFKTLFRNGLAPVPKRRLDAIYPNRQGIPVVREELCNGCGDCVRECPTRAISLREDASTESTVLSVFYGACISCRQCIDVCGQRALESAPVHPPIGTNCEELISSHSIDRRNRYNNAGGVQNGSLR